MSNPAEEKLIIDIIGNDSKARSRALNSIYQKGFDPVKKMVLRHNGTTEMAEDIFQEGVTVLYQNLKLGKFNGDSSLHTYLYNICRYQSYKVLNRELKVQIITPDEIADEKIDSVEFVSTAIDEIVNALGDSCRQLLTAFYYDGKSMIEISKIFKLGSDQAARNKKARCMKSLITKIKALKMSVENFVK